MLRIGIIGGSGLEKLLQSSGHVRVGTPYGPAPLISIGYVGKEEVAFLPRHGPKHDLPPHKVNYRANMYGLKKLGVERIIATNAVGGINSDYAPGDICVPQDILDFTKSRAATYYDKEPVTHIDVSEPYCPELRDHIVDSARVLQNKVWANSILAATEGPRYETPAEIRMIQKSGGDIVGMTGAPEVFLARELELCYSTICFVSNRAAGMQQKLSAKEVMEVGADVMPKMNQIIEKTVEIIPKNRKCACARATDEARV
ncbi:MAG: S-methyl-5'-thioadenosine phosphorylase [Candidatus Bathyarchaeia archaeon]